MSTSSNKRTLDEQVRRDYLASRSAQLSAALKALKPPREANETEQPSNETKAHAKPIVDGIVKDEHGTEDADGLLHKDVLKEDLVVKIPIWENLPTFPLPGMFETVQLKYSLTGTPGSFQTIGAVRRFDLPIDPDIFPLEMALPKEALPRDAKLWVLYAHKNFSSSDSVDSLPIQLTCDAVAPWDEQEPRFEQAPSEPINEAYLGLHPAGIELTLADYPDRKPDDRCSLYYLDEWPRNPDDLIIPAYNTVLDDTLKVTVPTAVVRNRDDGRFYITYLLYDKATNRSRMAFPVQVDVVLGPQPEDLLPPEVPLAADGVVGMKDALAGVTVRIPAYSNRKNQDVLLIKWGDDTLDAEPMGTRPFPVDVPVPNAILHTNYGAATGPKTTRVSYQVMRGQVAYGPESTDVEVDFSVVGPDPDPNWPDPINTKLAAPRITSSTGLDNELAPADRDQPATLSFPLYANAANGHVMDFYWDGTLVTEARYVVSLADGPEVECKIPWSYISDAGNNEQLPVHYTVRGDVDAINEQESPRQLVNVHAISMTPDPMEFLDLDGPWLNCTSLWFDPDAADPEPVFRARVPAIPERFNVSPGTQITLNWYVTKDMAGQDEIDEVKLVQSRNLSADDIEKGFIWQIGPYDRHILPIYDPAHTYAFAHVFYSVLVPGKPALISDATQNIVSIAVSDGNLTCHV
ncbi:hypothetical protein KSS93_10960 [Pseudomonas xanthosomatis]|uniref:hypothetical protein n=1 Tax=Pseudomonas xanthosomatis TaxID=2842356 RepID=UPI001C3E8381|nr:hypothetical protein [Pseudomonas xanthosomatis]QXH48395.1 hypothetical protein KSS93_10960 [Pseudomonas xanthosomatis]